MEGDVVVSGDFRKSYLVGPGGQQRRLSGDEHAQAVALARNELASAPANRQRREQIANAVKASLEGGGDLFGS